MQTQRSGPRGLSLSPLKWHHLNEDNTLQRPTLKQAAAPGRGQP